MLARQIFPRINFQIKKVRLCVVIVRFVLYLCKFMSEFIIIQVGQCGNQIGSCLLPEILQEYDVRTSSEQPPSKSKHDLQEYIGSFFNFPSNSKRCPQFQTLADLINSGAKARFLCIDMEDSVVSRVKLGKFRDLYDKKCLITNYPGSANNWAEGYHNHGPRYKQKILKAVQYTTEQCDNLNGFIIFLSMGGGTGSGLGTYIVKLLHDHYPNTERFVVCVYPLGTEDVITAPYNMAFATQELSKWASCVFPVENRALFDISRRQMGRYATDICPFKPYEDVNKIIVDMILHLTSGSRFGGKMNMDIGEIGTNMVPFPTFNFLSSGFSPFKFKLGSLGGNNLRNELFLTACSRNNQLLKVDPLDSRFVSMSFTLLGRGKYSINDMRNYVDKIKTKLKFSPWSSKAVKIGMCDVPPKGLEFSMFSLTNTTSMVNLFGEVESQFSRLYQRKAHIHHYSAISGFSLDNFNECHVHLNDIIHSYKEIEQIKL